MIRTTADNPGYVHGLTIGAGSSLDSAVEELMTDGPAPGREACREYQNGGQDDTEWAFEVVDVRLTTGPIGGPAAEAWVAYGTLVSDGRTPWAQGSYWDRDRR